MKRPSTARCGFLLLVALFFHRVPLLPSFLPSLVVVLSPVCVFFFFFTAKFVFFLPGLSCLTPSFAVCHFAFPASLPAFPPVFFPAACLNAHMRRCDGLGCVCPCVAGVGRDVCGAFRFRIGLACLSDRALGEWSFSRTTAGSSTRPEERPRGLKRQAPLSACVAAFAEKDITAHKYTCFIMSYAVGMMPYDEQHVVCFAMVPVE